MCVTQVCAASTDLHGCLLRSRRARCRPGWGGLCGGPPGRDCSRPGWCWRSQAHGVQDPGLQPIATAQNPPRCFPPASGVSWTQLRAEAWRCDRVASGAMAEARGPSRACVPSPAVCCPVCLVNSRREKVKSPGSLCHSCDSGGFMT